MFSPGEMINKLRTFPNLICSDPNYLNMNEIEKKNSRLFTTADMQYDDYQWNPLPSNDPRVSGTPDKSRFNRNQGYEMLYLINEIANMWQLKQISSCLKMERMIKEAMPERLAKQEVIMEWVRKNWDRF